MPTKVTPKADHVAANEFAPAIQYPNGGGLLVLSGRTFRTATAARAEAARQIQERPEWF